MGGWKIWKKKKKISTMKQMQLDRIAMVEKNNGFRKKCNEE